MKHTAYLSIGSNLGEKAENCRESIRLLEESGLVQVTAVSKFYRTAPVDYLDQDFFVNAALKVRTDLSPHDLLVLLQGIQERMGQFEKKVRFGPRIIDLDIVFFDQRIIEAGDLVVPHPRMHERGFVLVPLCDIDADFLHPVLGVTVGEILAGLDEKDQDVREM